MQTLSYYGCKNGHITIKSRHLVDDVHTSEINTQKPFEIIQHKVHCVLEKFPLIQSLKIWRLKRFR